MPRNTSASATWETISQRLQQMLNEGTFGTWFGSARAIDQDDTRLVVGVPNEFTKTWIEGHFGSLLDEAADVGSLDASATEFDAGLLTLRDATLRKRGNELTGTARVTEGDLRSAVPFLDGVQPVASANGQLTLRGTATLLGVTASVDATVAADQGRLIVQPDVPFGGLATVTVFSDPRLEVQGVSAASAPDGFSVSATGRLR